MRRQISPGLFRGLLDRFGIVESAARIHLEDDARLVAPAMELRHTTPPPNCRVGSNVLDAGSSGASNHRVFFITPGPGVAAVMPLLVDTDQESIIMFPPGSTYDTVAVAVSAGDSINFHAGLVPGPAGDRLLAGSLDAGVSAIGPATIEGGFYFRSTPDHRHIGPSFADLGFYLLGGLGAATGATPIGRWTFVTVATNVSARLSCVWVEILA